MLLSFTNPLIFVKDGRCKMIKLCKKFIHAYNCFVYGYKFISDVAKITVLISALQKLKVFENKRREIGCMNFMLICSYLCEVVMCFMCTIKTTTTS